MQIVMRAVPGSPVPCGSKKKEHLTLHDLMHEHDSLCYYCEEECVIICDNPTGQYINIPNLATRDHMIPKSHGGTVSTLVLACAACNNKLGNISLEARAKFITFKEDNA